jgi:hypothetical protein
MKTCTALFIVLLLLTSWASASEPLVDKTFGGAMTEEIFRVRLDRGIFFWNPLTRSSSGTASRMAPCSQG